MESLAKIKYTVLLLSICAITIEAAAAGPSFDCGKVAGGSIEEMVCTDELLAALDVKLAEVYEAALQKAVNEQPPTLKAEQRGWIKGRDDCWKSSDESGCVENEYKRRIAELQARYRLIPAIGPTIYTCDADPRNEVIVTFFRTDPPTLIAEHGDSVSLMYLAKSGSGAKYEGRNEIFWEHQGEALIVWGYGASEMHCKRPGAPALSSAHWLEEVERAVGTKDSAGHGPDIGSEEWMYAVSRKLGVHDLQGHGPDPGSVEWKYAVHRLVFRSGPDL